MLQYTPLQLDSISLLTTLLMLPLYTTQFRLPQQGITDLDAYTRHFFFSVLEAGRPRLRYKLGWFLVRPLFLACGYPRSPCVLTWPFPCGCVEREIKGALVSLSLKNISLIGYGPLDDFI